MTLLLVLLAMVDGGILIAAALAWLHPGGALLLHLALSLAALALWWRGGTARRFAPVLAMALGPVAIACAMAAPAIGALARRLRLLGLPTRDGDEPIVVRGSGGAMVARLLDGRVRHPDPDNLGSLIGVLRHGTVDERRGALEAAVRSFDPRLSTVVAKALTDDDQTIRALAAAASNLLSQRLVEERAALAEARAKGEKPRVTRLSALLMDHSRFDILLSDTQRQQVAKEAILARTAQPERDGVQGRIGDEALLIHALEDSWKAHDFETLDLLCAKAAQSRGLTQDPVWTAAGWWAAQPCG
ncbi:hypothetical protein LWE61_07035 [Sphingobium sufflavum]|uniref:hypothetical protein n=1 Tax=Sphingobium sufflavum TaxID=1129547 RepID=UPI001F2A7AC3|nr:hypothetical protein [Sphingobium sufflavum]MCE7796316.1 hypothetical protein [Sphingobium sufflavum]